MQQAQFLATGLAVYAVDPVGFNQNVEEKQLDKGIGETSVSIAP